MKPGEKQLWRIANTCSMAILQLSLVYDGVAQDMIGVARDGVAMGVNQTAVLNTVGSLGTGATVWQLFPGSRIELIVIGPSASVSKSQLVTTFFDTGPDGDSDPSYPLLTIVPDEAVVKSPDFIVPANPADAQTLQRVPRDLAQQTAAVTRILDFYEESVNASDPNSDTIFYVTPRGQPRVAFPDQKWPNINVTQGVVEDWIINNPTQEEHIFHIHQMHFLVMERDSLTNPTPLLGTGLDQMWDVIDVPCCNHSVKIRVDFTGMQSTLAPALLSINIRVLIL